MSIDLQSYIRSLFSDDDRNYRNVHHPDHYSQCRGTWDPYGIRVLSENKKRFFLSHLRRGEIDNLFEQNTLTFIDNEGPKVIETYSAHVTECGHIVGLTEDNTLSAVCTLCDQVLCTRCSGLQCYSCNSTICKNCSSRIGGNIICSRCKIPYILKRCIGTSISALHNLLSKNF